VAFAKIRQHTSRAARGQYRRFHRPAERRGINPIQPDAIEIGPPLPGLKPANFIQWNVFVTLQTSLRVPVGFSVTK
jgi:hypothetical protein